MIVQSQFFICASIIHCVSSLIHLILNFERYKIALFNTIFVWIWQNLPEISLSDRYKLPIIFKLILDIGEHLISRQFLRYVPLKMRLIKYSLLILLWDDILLFLYLYGDVGIQQMKHVELIFWLQVGV